MKKGKSLTELATQLEDIRANARDFLVPTAKLEMSEDAKISFKNGEDHKFTPSPHAHGQIAQYSGVPKAYYDRLQAENSPLLAQNVNHGFGVQAKTPGRGGLQETRMVRAYKDDVRAILSSSYRRLDSYDMCQAILPVLLDNRFEVVSSEITDTRLYIKALTPKVQTEIKKGDVVQYGLVISNSDVGAGSVRVEPLLYRLVCSNGLICNTALRKFHVGRNMAGDDVTELLSQETLSLTDKAFWAQITDLVKISMRPDHFEAQVNRLRQAAEMPIKNFDIPEVVEMAMKATGTNGENVKKNIIAYLANGADGAGLTQWGLINGYTFAAQQDGVSYDTSIDLERSASKILELSPSQWTRIAG